MGPDEFHSHVDNNAFTNRLAQWHLRQAVRLHEQPRRLHPAGWLRFSADWARRPTKLTSWREVAEKLVVAVDAERGVIEQFEGYFDRLDVPITEWDEQRHAALSGRAITTSTAKTRCC